MPEHLPPAYVALNIPSCLAITSQMYECMELCEWSTCVVCWRAWYDLPPDYHFDELLLGAKASPTPWFTLADSAMLMARRRGAVNQWRLGGAVSAEAARQFLAANYSPDVCAAVLARAHSPGRRRSVAICHGCQGHVGNDGTLAPAGDEMRMCDYVVDPVRCSLGVTGREVALERFEGVVPPGSASDSNFRSVLGLSVSEFAPALAALTDHEEMVLALVHPLVQVYTLPRTGQLAYVGHICNFRQRVSTFLASLPRMPSEMPFVMVRPRTCRGSSAGKALFKVNVWKLRRAFEWLKEHNPYYDGVEWRDDAAAAWEAEDVQLGVVREAEEDLGHAPPVSGTCFRRWMQLARAEGAAGDRGYAIGRRVLDIVLEDSQDANAPAASAAAAPGSASVANDIPDVWDAMRRAVAEVFERSAFRMTTSLPQDVLVVALSARGAMDLGLPQDQSAEHILRSVRTIDADVCPVDLSMFRSEVDAVLLEQAEEETSAVVHAGVIAAGEVGDDVGLRESTVDSLAAAAEELCGGAVAPSEAAPVSGSAAPCGTAPLQPKGCKYPRVDPPGVEDAPGQAIREDTPGYIAKAFPKLFPHGAGDYHGDHAGLRRTLRFEEWGRYLMMWHDGRFMRHTRFRYWLLDTMLRVMVPGVQRVFFRTRQACDGYTLESLTDPAKRRELVQQMSSVTNMIPGSIGERRKMRQELEAMVHQVEAETADLGMNGGAGRIPAGFCTLTCAVYKWAQLHDTVLKAYPSGPSDDPTYREYYTQWQALPPGSARKTAMKKCTTSLQSASPALWHGTAASNWKWLLR